MSRRDATPRDLLFGLLALQNGLIEQDQLVAAFSAWSRAKGTTLAEILVGRGAIEAEDRALLVALAERQLKLHGGDAEKSIAAIASNPSIGAWLGALGEDEPSPSVPLDGADTEPDDPERTASQDMGASTSEGLRFRVLRPHAKGGLGEVFVALDGELNREVALKQILDHHADDQVSRSRFLLEAEVTGGLEHPGIVPVYGLGRHRDGRPYYAMRFIRGDSLREAIAAFHADESLRRDPGRHSLALRKLLRRFVDVCNAVDYAHGRGILHRDLKPSNVIVGKHGETLVVDWGLAKATGHSLPTAIGDERTLMPSSSSGSAETLPGSAMGTPAYMSPEQAAGDQDKLGPRSDVYSLGATLYCLLTGRPPFLGTDVGPILRDVRKGSFPHPRQVAPTIDRALEAVCLKAMAIDPEARHASARALADDVERWAADEPTSAWAEPLSVRARRWMRRNRTAAAVAGVALVALLIGTGAVLAVQTRANADLKKANNALAVANGETRAALAQTKKAQQETAGALTQSEESRKQAEAVGTFLVDAFRKPDPSIEGKDVKVADILDQALAGLDGDFAGSKATRGALLNAVGRSYQGLGLYPKAEEAHRRALAVREEALGPDHPSTLTSRNNLAIAYQDAGRGVEAIPIFEATLKQREAKLGPDHLDTLATRNNLAIAYQNAGRVAEAIPIFEATLRRRESKLGPDHPDALASRNNLAVAYQAAGRVVEAIPIFEATLKQKESKLGPDHPSTLASRNDLARAYQDAGRVAQAIPIFEATLKQYESKLGPDHPGTLTSRSNLALAYQAAGRFAEAIPIFEETLRRFASTLGPDHPNTLISRTNLASAYQTAGRFAEAIAIYEATLRQYESKIGPDHPSTLSARNNLAVAYQDAGRVAEAIPIFEATLRRRESKLGPDHPSTLNTRNNLALAYRIAGRFAEAIPIFEAALKQKESKLGPDHPSTLTTRNNLALAYRDAGRVAQAIPIYESTLRRFESTLGPDHPSTLTTRTNLASAYRATGRVVEAIPIFEATLKQREAKLGPDHPNTLTTRTDLASAYEVLDRWADAEALFRDTLARRRKREKADSTLLAVDLANLGRNLLKQSKGSEAEPLARECLAIRLKAIPDDYRRFNAASLLGGALLAQGKYAEAESLIVEGYEGMKARESKIAAGARFNLADAAERVVQLYRAWDKPKEAADWAGRLGLADLPADVFAR